MFDSAEGMVGFKSEMRPQQYSRPTLSRLGCLKLIAERPDKCQRSAVIWQCLVSSISVMCAQAADAD
jgi:hypothetical protein